MRGNVAPLVNGTPQPAAVDDGVDLADLLLIERKALGKVSFLPPWNNSRDPQNSHFPD
ncbi:MAG: hypothetical protein WCH04_03355 [Gammaproteobacteria bacterium]